MDGDNQTVNVRLDLVTQYATLTATVARHRKARKAMTGNGDHEESINRLLRIEREQTQIMQAISNTRRSIRRNKRRKRQKKFKPGN